MSIKDWNIDGIANEVTEDIKADQADINDVDDYVNSIAYLTVCSRDTRNAGAVADLVKEKVKEKYEEVE